MKNLQEAKKNLLVNVGTNVLTVAVIALIGIWLTPYLIQHLGVAVYSMVPLVSQIVAYFGLFTLLLTSVVGRFVALSIDKGDYEKSNIYFNSAFFTLLILCSLMLIPAIITAVFLPRIFQVPKGYETATSWLFLLVILSAFFAALTSPFLVSTFVTHRFYLNNLAQIISRFLQIAIIVLCFIYLSASLKYVGLGHCGMMLFVLVCSIFLTRYLTPQLHISCRSFKWYALREMGVMGTWMIIDQLGALLYYSTALVLINLFLGPEQGGRYAPVLQWVLLLRVLAPALSGVFAPVAFDFIAKGDLKTLSFQTKRAIKFMGLLLALPTGLICGLSQPLLQRWLGHAFTDLSGLMLLLIAPQVALMAVNPLYNINRGMNKVRVPAFATLGGGLTNLILSVLLLHYTDLGLYGVALASIFSFTARNIFFMPMYTASITGQQLTVFVKSVLPGVIMVPVVALAGWCLSRSFNLASYPYLILSGMFISIMYVPVCFTFMLNRGEKSFLWSLIGQKKP